MAPRAGSAARQACLRPATTWRFASAVPRIGDGLGALDADAALGGCEALQQLGFLRAAAQFCGIALADLEDARARRRALLDGAENPRIVRLALGRNHVLIAQDT